MARFVKYHGLGNDFIFFDGREVPDISREAAARLCHRHFGIGGDGVVLVLPSSRADRRMRIVNSDGSEAEMCGNALRCFARYVWDEGVLHNTEMTVETIAGIMRPRLRIDADRVVEVSAEIGRPLWRARDVPTTLASPDERVTDVMLDVAPDPARTWQETRTSWLVTALRVGVPHTVVFVADLDAVEYLRYGPRIEHHPAFPEKTNVMFTQVLARDRIRVRPWERAVGPTLACGTGGAAAAVAAAYTGRTDRDVAVVLPGGTLRIGWDADTGEITMAGPAERVFEGEVAVSV